VLIGAVTVGLSGPGGSGGGHEILDETTPLTQRAELAFQGAGVTATDDSGNDRTVVTIPGGVSDHGALTGLSDDDHTQYHNNARGDLRYDALGAAAAAQAASQPVDSDLTAIAALSTTAFGRGLLTLADAAALLAASGGAAASHAHSGSDITSGTVAEARIDSAIARDAEVAAAYQPLDSELTAIAALTPTNGQAILGNGSTFVMGSPPDPPTVAIIARTRFK
jgi:hypothetical protein